MNRRIPYNPDRQRGGCGTWLLWLMVPSVVGAYLWLSGVRPSEFALLLTPVPLDSVPVITSLTPPPTVEARSTVAPEGVPATEQPLPTSTFVPAPSPSPTALLTPAPTQFYTTQSGDTLAALAARFGVNPADIVVPAGLQTSTTLAHNQLLVIPNVLGPMGPGQKLIPDSELVYSGAAAAFDPQSFALDQGGYLARYVGAVDGAAGPGGDVILAAARNHSINPRLLVALLEYHSGWVTNSQPQGAALRYPFGYVHDYLINLNAQLTWATSRLGTGYYSWRTGSLTELTFLDGSSLRLDPSLNAGTVALQYYFAQTLNRPEWDEAVGPAGFAATYAALFGDPFARALEPLLPPNLTQVSLALPFAPGETWAYTGGPHGAWEAGGAQAALDFAPGAGTTGCGTSGAWITAVAAGLVLRSVNGAVMVDLDGDGREATGWGILYLHVATQGRVKAGTFIEQGDRIGHPSCEGGRATGAHVHIARKYNGEWAVAYGVIPFNLNGWVAGPGKGEYFGTLSREGVIVEACTCTAAWTAVTHDR
jgi:LasA protease